MFERLAKMPLKTALAALKSAKLPLQIPMAPARVYNLHRCPEKCPEPDARQREKSG